MASHLGYRYESSRMLSRNERHELRRMVGLHRKDSAPVCVVAGSCSPMEYGSGWGYKTRTGIPI